MKFWGVCEQKNVIIKNHLIFSPAQSFSSALLPGSQPETERRHVVEENPGFFDRFSGKNPREKIQRKNDQFRQPQFGSIQDKLEFNEPEYEQITQVNINFSTFFEVNKLEFGVMLDHGKF